MKYAEDMPILAKQIGETATAMSKKVRSNNLLSAVNKSVTEYLEGYEVRGDNGNYTPNEQESFLIYDAIQGLLADDDFINSMKAWTNANR